MYNIVCIRYIASMEDQLLLLNEVWKMEDQLLHCNSIITGSPRGSQIFFQCKCVKISADDRGIYNASCENHTPCVFPSQVWHQLISSPHPPRGDFNGSLDIQCLRNGWSCVIKRQLSNFCLQNKTVVALGNLIMMVNNAGDVH